MNDITIQKKISIFNPKKLRGPSVSDIFKNKRKYLHNIFDTIFDGIILINSNGTIALCNSAIQQLLGYQQEELIGCEIDIILRYKQDSLMKCISMISTIKHRHLIGICRDHSTIHLEAVIDKTSLLQDSLIMIVVRDNPGYKKNKDKIKDLNQQLLISSQQAAMAEMASRVLHNVGNVLNSINVSASLISEKLHNSEMSGLIKISQLIKEHQQDMGRFITEDEQGKFLPEYLVLLSKFWQQEQGSLLREVNALVNHVHHIKNIIRMQQSFGGVIGVAEPVKVASLIDDALVIATETVVKHEIILQKDYEDIPEVFIDKVKLLQILINLLSNASEALLDSDVTEKRLLLHLYAINKGRFRIEIIDNGIGISQGDLKQIFSYGFTTKRHGHGYGLHTCALLAEEMRGRLSAYSAGKGQGATFILELPCIPNYQLREH